MSFQCTTTTAWPERQISPVSRFPVEKDSTDFDEFSRMRPYARWRIELFPGVMETCRPACALVFRKTIFSTAACCGAVMETPFSRKAWPDSGGGTHPFRRFIANYKNCPPRSQTVKTEVPIQRDSTTHAGKSQPQPSNALALTALFRRVSAYQLWMVPSRRRFTGRYARR